MSDDKSKPTEVLDDELNDLLDSALEDLNKVPKEESNNDNVSTSQPDATKSITEQVSTDDQWTQDFIQQTAAQFEKNLQNLVQNGGEGEFGASLQKMAQTVASAISGGESSSAEPSTDFQAAIGQALKDLSDMSQNLQTGGPGFGEADLSAMFGRTSLEDESLEFPSLMKGMMQCFLSKEVLYPTMKELVDKYPAWLEEKKNTLPASELERYTKQSTLMQQVCTELEKEQTDDSEETKKSRFEKILGLMQEMQNCGQPPEELVGQPALFQNDSEGNPIFPPGADMPENCCIM